MSHINPVNIHTPHLFKIPFNIILSKHRSARWSLPFWISNQNVIVFHTSIKLRTLRIPLDLTTLIIYREEYKI